MRLATTWRASADWMLEVASEQTMPTARHADPQLATRGVGREERVRVIDIQRRHQREEQNAAQD